MSLATRGAAALFLALATPAVAQPDQPSVAERWDRTYDRPTYVYGKEPVTFLVDVVGRLRKGTALDLAAGEGRNAVYLAQQGFEVTAVDVSAKGLAKCTALAAERGVTVRTVVADLDTFDLGRERWDLVADFYYHDPALFAKAVAGLKPGGFFVYQHFSTDQPQTNRFGPRNPAWLAAPNQLVAAFAGWRLRHYEDTVVTLDEGMHQGPGAVVRLLVEKVPVAPAP